MKVREKEKAIALRKKGVSMQEIARRLDVSKSSVSYWVRDVHLTDKQRDKLNRNGHSIHAIEKRRESRLANTQKNRELIMQDAYNEVDSLLKDSLWCLGVALYWGEGGKTQQVVRIANSDPDIIKTMVKFFTNSCQIPKDKFRGHVHTFSHKNAREAEQYWSKISGIPIERFYKTYVKQSRASLQKRDTLPFGTFQIYIHNTTFFFRMMGWIEGLKDRNA